MQMIWPRFRNQLSCYWEIDISDCRSEIYTKFYSLHVSHMEQAVLVTHRRLSLILLRPRPALGVKLPKVRSSHCPYGTLPRPKHVIICITYLNLSCCKATRGPFRANLKNQTAWSDRVISCSTNLYVGVFHLEMRPYLGFVCWFTATQLSVGEVSYKVTLVSYHYCRNFCTVSVMQSFSTLSVVLSPR